MSNPTVPNPATWVPGPVLVPSLRDDVSNAVGFLSGPPLFQGYNSTSLSIPTGANSAITLDSEVIDTWGGHTSGASNYYCQAPGWHIVNVGTQFAYTSATVHNFTASVGASYGSGLTIFQGEQVGGGSTQDPGPCAVELVPLANVGTDYVQASCRQDTGGAVSLAGDPYLAVRWVASLGGAVALPVPANASWPVPPSYVTSAFLNANIRDTINFLTLPPIFRGYYAGSGNTIGSGTWPAVTGIILDTTSGSSTTAGGDSIDNYSGWNAAGNYWAAPVAGVYSCYGQLSLAATANAYQVAVGFNINGTAQWLKQFYQPASTVPRSALACRKLRLSAGDQVKLIGFQNSGGTLSVIGSGTSACFTKLIIVWEAA